MRAFGFVVVVCVLGWGAGVVVAQTPEEDQAVASGGEEARRLETSVQSLEALYRSMQARKADVAAVQEALQAATDEVTRADLLARLKFLKEESEQLSQQFTEFAAAVDVSVFAEEEPAGFNWQQEVGAVLQPIIAEVKSATAESRVVTELRNEIDELGKRLSVAESAAGNLEHLLAVESTDALDEKLRRELEVWEQRRADAANRKQALELQLENRLAERKSLLDSTTGYVQTFVNTRGLNLLLGIGSFCLVFFGLRFLGSLTRRLRPSGRERKLSGRLFALFFHGFSALGAILAMLLVFNAVGDWFLLGIILIFLLGVGWASINTLPQHVETVKLMLNIGSVREGERILYDGLPWRVEGLGIAARLSNPLLEGGEQTIPVKYLVGMHSRVPGADEAWFPYQKGEWVWLPSERLGRIVNQSPSYVSVVELGGSRVEYPTPEFMALGLRRLSHGFRVSVGFGIDYRHQGICTTEVPAIMQRRLETGLCEVFGVEAVRNIQVEFKEAAASSLDYQVDVDFDGEAASRFNQARRAIPRILVDVCNEEGWEIPFQQITLHGIPAQG